MDYYLEKWQRAHQKKKKKKKDVVKMETSSVNEKYVVK